MDEKIFRDTRTQIGILRSRGLVIKNTKFAKKIIRETNYYNLINGYKTPFLRKNTSYETYLNGTRFEELYALYEFDRKLRIVTLEVILKIEKQVKSLISYTFSKEYGHKDYLRYENFDTNGSKKYKQVSELLSQLYRKISDNIDKDLSVSHYVNGKNYIPLWVLVNTMSLGEISKFYVNMLQHDKNEVAKCMKWGVRENELSNCLFFLSSIRNRCAHDELLYCYNSYVNLINNKYFNYFRIAGAKNTYFAVMIVFKMLLNTREYNIYQKKIEVLLEELTGTLTTISVKKIQRIMGFPNNWRYLKTMK